MFSRRRLSPERIGSELWRRLSRRSRTCRRGRIIIVVRPRGGTNDSRRRHRWNGVVAIRSDVVRIVKVAIVRRIVGRLARIVSICPGDLRWRCWRPLLSCGALLCLSVARSALLLRPVHEQWPEDVGPFRSPALVADRIVRDDVRLWMQCIHIEMLGGSNKRPAEYNDL